MEYFKAKYANRASSILHVLAAGGVRLFSFLGEVYDGAAGEEPLSLELDPFSLSCGPLETRDFPRDAQFLCLIWAAENWSRGQLSCARAPRRRSLPPLSIAASVAQKSPRLLLCRLLHPAILGYQRRGAPGVAGGWTPEVGTTPAM